MLGRDPTYHIISLIFLSIGCTMNNFRSLADIRRDYGDLILNEDSAAIDPIEQFKLWFEEVLKNENELLV